MRNGLVGRSHPALAIVVLILLRGAVAAATPLSYDEAYYWLWSKHLAFGYYDHPPMIAWLIRAGTSLFGDTSLGVRFGAWLLSAGASWAVWRAAVIVLGSGEAALFAALLFNLMPMIGIETFAATPDAPEIAAAAFFLVALARIGETRQGGWWLAAGAAAGFGLLSKYTAFFLGLGALAWLAADREQSRWLRSFWPYLGGALAVAMFTPVVLWNAEHGWISFAAQFGRLGSRGGFTLRFLIEFVAGQIALASPFIAVLIVDGLLMPSRRARRARRLLIALIAPAMLYFVWHSLHDRVQGNWPSFLYPGFAVAAAAAGSAAGAPVIIRVSRLLAIPVALVLTALLYAQALWAVVPGIRDPVSRLLAVGIEPVTAMLERMRTDQGATGFLTTSYALTAWLSFYCPSHPPVIQLNERFRWLNDPSPLPAEFTGPWLYVTLARDDRAVELRSRFRNVAPLRDVQRMRAGAVLDEYRIYRVEGMIQDPFDQGR